MNKARAMLDALMGPNRDEKTDTAKAREKFKDPGVCRGFLLGLCPLDPAYLGGKRQFKPCDKIHSEIMRDQFLAHPEVEELRGHYEASLLPELERVVRDCDAKVAEEKGRIRDDWGRRRPPLAVPVIDKVSSMKRDSAARAKQAESLDDDKSQEKARLMAEAEDIAKEANAIEEEETRRAIAALDPEEVCEICGTSYLGSTADTAHRKFKIHKSYQEIRQLLAELKPRVDARKLPPQEERRGREAEKEASSARERGHANGEKHAGRERASARRSRSRRRRRD